MLRVLILKRDYADVYTNPALETTAVRYGIVSKVL